MEKKELTENEKEKFEAEMEKYEEMQKNFAQTGPGPTIGQVERIIFFLSQISDNLEKIIDYAHDVEGDLDSLTEVRRCK